MRWLRPEGGDLTAFFGRVREAPERLLLLDYDGTLAPFREERNEAVPYPGVRERLSAMVDTGGSRVAVISGRATRDLVSLLGLPHLLEIWGSHGGERLLPGGTYEVRPLPAGAGEVLDHEAAWLREEGLAERCERKPAGVALHWRGMMPLEHEVLEARVHARWRAAVQVHPNQLAVHAFDGGLELRVPGVDKGQVVEQILAEASPEAAVVFLGDDLTDEDAFRALAGRGLSVLVRTSARPTAAELWLEPPGELLDFLDRWADATRRQQTNE